MCSNLAAPTNQFLFLSLHLILHPCFDGTLAVSNCDCRQFNAQLLLTQLNHVLTVSSSHKSFAHYHSTSVSIISLHRHELDTRWVYEHLCCDNLIKTVIVAVHFAAVLKRYTVSTSIHTAVFDTHCCFFFVLVFEYEPLESRDGV